MPNPTCRDCPACTRSFMAKVMQWMVAAPMFAAAGRPVIKTCPDCGHALGRHQRRRDGSFID